MSGFLDRPDWRPKPPAPLFRAALLTVTDTRPPTVTQFVGIIPAATKNPNRSLACSIRWAGYGWRCSGVEWICSTLTTEGEVKRHIANWKALDWDRLRLPVRTLPLSRLDVVALWDHV